MVMKMHARARGILLQRRKGFLCRADIAGSEGGRERLRIALHLLQGLCIGLGVTLCGRDALRVLLQRGECTLRGRQIVGAESVSEIAEVRAVLLQRAFLLTEEVPCAALLPKIPLIAMPKLRL